MFFAGDLVHHATDSAFDRFLYIIGELEIPFYLVPGNHDVGNIPNDSTLSYYREKLGADYYTFTHGGYGDSPVYPIIGSFSAGSI